jgi:hypothetical protein
MAVYIISPGTGSNRLIRGNRSPNRAYFGHEERRSCNLSEVPGIVLSLPARSHRCHESRSGPEGPVIRLSYFSQVSMVMPSVYSIFFGTNFRTTNSLFSGVWKYSCHIGFQYFFLVATSSWMEALASMAT